ncbi:V-type proton ATPase subunit G 1, partial [Spheniscus magellanicus]
MASQSQGIQQLLQAEKRAAEKVAEARKREYGPARPRPAPPRRGGGKGVSLSGRYPACRRPRRGTCGAVAALGSHGSCTTEVEKETQEKMSVIQQNFQKNREVVLSQLLLLVCDIKPEIHVNYRING